MTTQFAKLMGNIKELEIELEKISTEIDLNLKNYLATNNQLMEHSTNLLDPISNLNEKNFHGTKEQFKDLTTIFKKELEYPIKSTLKKLDQLENNLNKIEEKIKSMHEKNENEHSKPNKLILLPEESQTLMNILNKTSIEIYNYKNLLIPLTEKLWITQKKITELKSKLDLYLDHKEQNKLIKQIKEFSNKLQVEEYIDPNNYSTLLMEIKDLEKLIKNATITSPKTLNTIEERMIVNDLILPQFNLETSTNSIQNDNKENIDHLKEQENKLEKSFSNIHTPKI